MFEKTGIIEYIKCNLLSLIFIFLIRIKLTFIFLQDKYKQTDRSKQKQITQKPIETFVLSKTQLHAFEGSYWNSQDKLSRKIEIRNDTLNYVRNNGVATKMIPIANNKFKWIDLQTPIVISFGTKESQLEFTLDIPGETPSEFRSYIPMSSFSASELEEYSGEYFSPELDIVYSLKIEDSNIELYVKGILVAPITPIMNNIMTISSFLTFEFNEAKDSIRLSMRRVKNLIFTKR